jgi:hypothetical protein
MDGRMGSEYTNIANLLFLSNMDQKINNNLIYAAGYPGHVALVAFCRSWHYYVFFLCYLLVDTK